MSFALWMVRLRGWFAGRPFERAARSPKAAQVALLNDIVTQNCTTAFGQDHHFGSIQNYNDYRANVPIRDYEGHRSYVDRIVTDNPQALTTEAPFMFGSTSGTTSAAKWVPVNQSWRRQLASIVRLWLSRAAKSHPKMLSGKVLTIVSPAVEMHAPNGLPVGSVSGLTNSKVPWIIRRNYAVPYEVAEIEDYELRYYVIARLGAESNVSLLITPNASTLHRIAEVVSEETQCIIEGIEKGTLGIDLGTLDPQQEALLDRIASKLKPNPKRAAYLKQLRDDAGTLLPKHIWSGLQLLGCWLGGSAGVQAKGLLEAYGNVPVRDVGFRATEGTFSVPLQDTLPDGVLALHANFYEFVPVDEIEKDDPIIHLAHEVEAGQQYYMIVTTKGGLYRYDINDVIEVTGFYQKAPLIKFLRKGRDMVNIVGEKLHVNQLLAAAEAATEKTGLSWVRFQVIPDVDAARYDLLLEPQGDPPSQAEQHAFVEAFDEQLMLENPEYPTKRKSGRLLLPNLVLMRSGWSASHRRWDVDHGKRDVQYKWPYVQQAWDQHSKNAVLKQLPPS